MKHENRFININHNTGSIYNPNGEPISVGDHGGIRIGYGDNLPNNSESDLSKYKGYVRTNTATGKLQICTGVEWLDIITEDAIRDDIELTNSLIF